MKTMRKLLSLVLALILAVSCLSGVYAAEGEEFTVTYEMPERTFSRQTSNQREEVGTGFEPKEYEEYRFGGWSEVPFTFMTIQDFQAGVEAGSIHLPGEMLRLTGDQTLYAVYTVAELYKYEVPHFEKYGVDKNEGDYILTGLSRDAGSMSDPGSHMVITKALNGIRLTDIPDITPLSNGDFTTSSWDMVFRFHAGGGPDGSRTIFDPVKQMFLCYDQELASLIWRYNPGYMSDFWNVSVNQDGSVNIFNYELPSLHLGYNSHTDMLCMIDAGSYFPGTIPDEYKIYTYARRPQGYGVTGYTTEVPLPCLWERFTDCPNKWYREAINYALSNKLMGGDGPNTFSPNGSMTRAMVVTVLYRAAGEPDVTGPSSFRDVPRDQWFTDAIAWAEQEKVVNGKDIGIFAPDDNITREQIATILWRYMGSPEVACDLSAFKDVASIDGYALEAMEWANKTGLMKGDAGCLKPIDFATRAEFAIMMMRWQGGHYKCTSVHAG